jgi:hypothetical protein
VERFEDRGGALLDGSLGMLSPNRSASLTGVNAFGMRERLPHSGIS